MGMNTCAAGISMGGRVVPFLRPRVDGPGCFARSSKMKRGVAISFGMSGRSWTEGVGDGEESGLRALTETELARLTVLGGTIPVTAGGKALA